MNEYTRSVIIDSVSDLICKLVTESVWISVRNFVRFLVWTEILIFVRRLLLKDDVEATRYQKELILKELLK